MSLIEISAFQFTCSRGRLITEVSERLVGSPAFKAGGTGDPRPAGSIPVHLRQVCPTNPRDPNNLTERNQREKASAGNRRRSLGGNCRSKTL